MSTRIIIGDARTRLAELRAGSVHCVVTSPPYWGLRDYGVAGQIGLELDYREYVATLVAVFREVRRVLRADGTVWLNLGDSYCSTDKWGGGVGGNTGKHTIATDGSVPSWAVRERKQTQPGLKPKDLMGIPWRVAFALQDDGWYLRQDIIWSKSNPMPESVTDRCTKAHEYIFLLSKSARYWFDADAIAEPTVRLWDETNGGSSSHRNKRSVWPIATQPYSEAHFACFPQALIEPCIRAGSPQWTCPNCGTGLLPALPTSNISIEGKCEICGSVLEGLDSATFPKGVILDPFFGAGTTGLVAGRLARNCIGIELNPAYAAMALRRISDDAGMFAETWCEAAE